MKRRTRVGAVMTVAAGVTMVSVAALSSAAQSEALPIPSGFGRANDVAAEYLSAVASLPFELPTGYVLPKQVPVALDASAIYQQGFGESFVYFQWQCAWMNVALRSGVSANDKQNALTQLDNWDQSEFYRDHIVEPEVTWEQAVLRSAMAGDMTAMASYAGLNCNGGGK